MKNQHGEAQSRQSRSRNRISGQTQYRNIGTFERSSRFDAHLDGSDTSLTLERTSDASTQGSAHLHIHYGLFAEILHDLARTTKAMPIDDEAHRSSLAEDAAALREALAAKHARAISGICWVDANE
jgi:hypothetical protein